MEGSETTRKMVRAFLAVIAGKGIQVIAEGIESERLLASASRTVATSDRGFSMDIRPRS